MPMSGLPSDSEQAATQSRLTVQLTGAPLRTLQEGGSQSSTAQAFPLPRVMSPSSALGTSRACHVCYEALRGPIVICTNCGYHVHSHCGVGFMQDTICEHCFASFRQAEASRRQSQAVAHGLGVLGARGSELVGTALGAAGAAGLAATQFLVHGAAAGARQAWVGSTSSLPPGQLTA